MKTRYKVLLSTILVSGAVIAIYKVGNNMVNINKEGSLSSASNLSGNRDEISPTAVLQKLSILGNRCRGCGKCVRIDSSHFEMNQSTQRAMVISSINLDSVALIQAINNCPAGAITLG